MINDGREFNEEARLKISADITFEKILPYGYILEHILIQNDTANQGQISLGSTNVLGDYFASEAINPSGQTLLNIKKLPIVKANTTLYLHTNGDGDTWNGMIIDIKFYFRKVIL